MEKGELDKGDNVVLSSFGAGFTSAALYLRWAISPLVQREEQEPALVHVETAG
jgi:hypothetical protein